MVREGNLIRVAPQAVLEKEREAESRAHKASVELAPLETRLIPVSYADGTEIQPRVQDLLSPRGTHRGRRAHQRAHRRRHRRRTSRSSRSSCARSTRRRRRCSSRRASSKRRATSCATSASSGAATRSTRPATGNPTGLAFPSTVGVGRRRQRRSHQRRRACLGIQARPSPNFAVNLPAAVGTGPGGALGLTLGSIDNNFNINLRLSALETSGIVRIIVGAAHPDARQPRGAISRARRSRSRRSARRRQHRFHEAKLQLTVKPHVTADGSVLMHVKINRDEPDFNQTSARGDPTILKREAETELLVLDGHTAVIGGIYTRNTGRNLDQGAVVRRHPDPRLALPAPPRERRPQRARHLHHAAHRQPRRRGAVSRITQAYDGHACAS